MNNTFLNSIGIDSNDSLESILEQLEEKQLEYFERLENVTDEKREQELREILSQIEKETSQVKKDLDSVKMSIIIDDGPKTGTAEKKQKKKSPAKNEEIAKDIEKLKSRGQNQKKQTAVSQEQKQQRSVGEVFAGLDAAEEDTAAEPAQISKESAKREQGNDKLSAALKSYKNGDYKEAFRTFSELAEKKDATAQLMLARMYSKGQGTTRDDDRSWFWYKSAGDLGNAEAQYAYGVHLLATNNGDAKSANTKNGMNYLEKAAAQNHLDAMDRYIEACEKGFGDAREIAKAVSYCDQRAGQLSDSYDKDKYKKRKKALQDRKKSVTKAKNKSTLPTVLAIIGSIVLVVGGLYLILGIHYNYRNVSPLLAKLPLANPKFILPITVFTNWAGGFLAIEGLLGMELIALGVAFRTAGSSTRRKKFASRICSLSTCLFIATLIWHIYIWRDHIASIQRHAVEHILAVVISLVVGYIVGLIVKKILRV